MTTTNKLLLLMVIALIIGGYLLYKKKNVPNTPVALPGDNLPATPAAAQPGINFPNPLAGFTNPFTANNNQSIQLAQQQAEQARKAAMWTAAITAAGGIASSIIGNLNNDDDYEETEDFSKISVSENPYSLDSYADYQVSDGDKYI